MSDRIFINGLSLHAYHGVMPYEGKVGQTFTLDLDLDHRSHRRRAFRQSCRHRLLRQGRRLRGARLLRAALPADRSRRRQGGRRSARRFPDRAKVEVTIHKPHAPIAATFSDVGVTLVRAQPFQAMTEALIALGGNVGDSRVILDRAVKLLCDGKDVRLRRARPTT